MNMKIKGAYVELIGYEIDKILDEMRNEKNKTSEKYMVLAQRLIDVLDAMDRAADLMITRFNYEIAEKEWCGEQLKTNKQKLIGFTNSRA